MVQEMNVGLDGLKEVVDFIKQKFGEYKIYAFYGTLGAGKTTIVREVLRSCGVVGPITSPTFTYMNCYKVSNGLGVGLENISNFYHFDLYRLSGQKEFFESGFGDYLEQDDAIVFLEWPEVIENILEKELRDHVCKVKIDYAESGNARAIRFEFCK